MQEEEQLWARMELSPKAQTPGVEVGKYSLPAGVEQRELRNTGPWGLEEAGQGGSSQVGASCILQSGVSGHKGSSDS